MKKLFYMLVFSLCLAGLAACQQNSGTTKEGANAEQTQDQVKDNGTKSEQNGATDTQGEKTDTDTDTGATEKNQSE